MGMYNWAAQFDDDYFSPYYKEQLEEQSTWTWDIPYLNKWNKHYVFVYGTLKRGGTNHVLLSSKLTNEFCGIGVTEREDLDFWIAETKVGLRFPVAIDSGYEPRKAKVKGELWLVPTETIIKMDKLESQGTVYKREQDFVWIGTERIMAHMYLGINEFWKNKDTFNNPIMKANGKPYHYYSPTLVAGIKKG